MPGVMRNKDHIEELEELIGTPHDLQGSIIDNVVSVSQSLSNQGLLNKSGEWVQGYLGDSTGVLVTNESESPRRITSDFIDCNSDDIVTIKSIEDLYMRRICFYDVSKTFISSVSDYGNKKVFRATIPSNTTYIRVTVGKVNINYTPNNDNLVFINNEIDNIIVKSLNGVSFNVDENENLIVTDANGNVYEIAMIPQA